MRETNILILNIIISAVEYEWLHIAVVVTCKTLNLVAFLVFFIQLAEILPTTHRSFGAGMCSNIAQVVVMTSPYIIYSVS